jgi:hypothetical protein
LNEKLKKYTSETVINYAQIIGGVIGLIVGIVATICPAAFALGCGTTCTITSVSVTCLARGINSEVSVATLTELKEFTTNNASKLS